MERRLASNGKTRVDAGHMGQWLADSGKISYIKGKFQFCGIGSSPLRRGVYDVRVFFIG